MVLISLKHFWLIKHGPVCFQRAALEVSARWRAAPHMTGTNCCLLDASLIFYSVKVELSHFAPNYFAVNLSDDSCRAVLIRHVTLNFFIDTSKAALHNLLLPNYGIYMMSQARLSCSDEGYFPPLTNHLRSICHYSLTFSQSDGGS